MTILEAMDNPKLFGPWFKKRTHGAWRVLLALLFGLTLTPDQKAVAEEHTRRKDLPAGPFNEAQLVIARRGGKSFHTAMAATYCAAFREYPTLAPGESACVMLLAADRAQAKILLGYISGFFERIPILAALVESRTAESISLKNGISIEVHTSDFRSIRGRTVVAAICDELAFWQTGESASPDVEVLNALRPAMATIPNAILLGCSSPYARKGALYEAYKSYFGVEGAPVLVWQGDTRSMNPSVSRLVIAAAYLRDAASARAEYGGEFRTDISSFVPIEAIEQCTVAGRLELARIPGKQYFAFTDPSGGSSDSFTLAIAHAEDDGTVVLDLVRETVPPFSPEAVIIEDAATVKQYGQSEVEGDRYAGEFPRERFAKCGVHYKVAERTRSELYLELLPGLMSGRVRLLDNKRLITQLSGLERRTARGGKDSIDHAPGGHDDVANAAAGAVVLAMQSNGGVLGLLEYEQLEASGKLDTLATPAWDKNFLFGFEQKILGLKPVSAEMWKEDPLPGCSVCKATIVTRLSATEFRCSECAAQWREGEARVYSPNRKDFLSGRLPSAREFKYPQFRGGQR